MEQHEIKKIVTKHLSEGIELSEIQNILRKEHNVNMTFFELRMLASELDDIDWTKLNKEDKPEAEQAENLDDGNEDDAVTPELLDESGNQIRDEHSSGKTVVEVSKLARPGAVASGSVKFGSGASAEWVLDQFGRLGLDKATGQPTEEDIQEFQTELQKALRGAV